MADVKNFSETPASAEELGQVKVGDGLKMGEDGTLSLDLVDAVDSTSATQAATANALKTAYDKAVAAEAAIANALPVGALLPSFASSMTGYLLCNGAAVSRKTYANLFSIIGTKFGAGNGSTTFNLPDFRDKTLWGANGNLMTTIAAGLPNIKAYLPSIFGWNTSLSPTGAFTAEIIGGAGYDGGSDNKWNVTFDASHYDPIYGKSTTVQPPAIAVNIFIKY